MKDKLLFFALLIASLSFGQQANTVTLKWEDNVLSSVGEAPVGIPKFQGTWMNYNAHAKKLMLSMSFPAAGAVNENSLQISDIIYETITTEQLGDLSVAAIPSSINSTLKASHARNDWYGVIKLSPIIKEGSGYKRVTSFTYTYTLSTSALSARSSQDFNSISNSVLATGEWYRFYVEQSGIYSINKSFLQQLGFNVDTDPRRIKIYGNGGRMLPLLNSTDYPADLAENAITFVGEEDGVFNNDDYILFYAEGTDSGTLNLENGTHKNLYADRSYYYVTSQGGEGKRIPAMMQPSASADVVTAVFDEYQYHEVDRVNVARLGRKWHGEEFNIKDEQEFKFNIPDIELQPASITVSAAANSITATTMSVDVNAAAIGTMSFVSPDQYSGAVDRSVNGTFTPTGSAITVKLTYNNNGVPGSNAWLDYIIIRARRKLRGNGKQFRFQYNATANNIGVIEYQLSNAAGISQIWDITDIYNVSKINNPAQASFSFKAPMGEARKYITVVPSDFYAPLREPNARVANQNLKGTILKNKQGQFQDVDYIIVAPGFLYGSAEKLADFHRTQSQLNVKVVSLDNIYQEFSSGKQDIGAIRNFIKYVYNNASSDAKKIKYINLFGDASFDYKNRIPNNTNIVPTFHAYYPDALYNHYSVVSTFVSDDFFGLMDPGEGRMTGGEENLDIAVGRMLVNSTSQADQMITKILEYRGAESYGRWRNEYLLVSDDIDDTSDINFVPTLEALATTLTANRPFINIRKIYTDSYIQEASAGGERYPEAKDQIIRAINFGTLVVNYLGHGGEEGMAAERIFDKNDAQRLTNKFKYPLFITTTCELTKFDNPYRPTTGEYLYWNPAGGAIAMITTTRAILVTAAFSFNTLLSQKLYSFDPFSGNLGEYPTMAEAMRQTKAQVTNPDFRVISFIGDPALELAIPKPKIVLTQINGVPAGDSADVLKALSYVKLSGRVTDEQENTLSGYTGELAVSVFDKPITRQTLNNDGAVRPISGTSPPAYEPAIYNFNVLGETIFRGNASVVNGQFEFGFVVPRDIRIPVGAGRVSFYSKKNGALEDHTGFNTAIKVGGVNENAAADNTAPKIKLYMNDETFLSGGITNESPIFLAFLEDENGINTASGIGHDIIAILDGDETNAFILNDYYETTLDNYTKGNLRYPFKNLEKGLHTLTFKAWDVYNNLVTAEIQFVVVGDEEMHLEKVLNYPNPFVSYTEFWFTHNRPFEPLDVQVQVFTVTGKVVKTINQSITTDGFLSRDIRWDGKDDFGDKIGKGVYIYKLTVKSTTSNKKAEKYEKLVLL
jgi:hypothetical protein